MTDDDPDPLAHKKPVPGTVYRSHICKDDVQVEAGPGGLLCDKCGCRTRPDENLVAIWELLDAAEFEEWDERTILEQLQALLEAIEPRGKDDARPDVWETTAAAVYVVAGCCAHLLFDLLEGLDLLDFGSSPSRAVLCVHGREVLAGFREYGCDPDNWPKLLWINTTYQRRHGRVVQGRKGPEG